MGIKWYILQEIKGETLRKSSSCNMEKNGFMQISVHYFKYDIIWRVHEDSLLQHMHSQHLSDNFTNIKVQKNVIQTRISLFSLQLSGADNFICYLSIQRDTNGLYMTSPLLFAPFKTHLVARSAERLCHVVLVSKAPLAFTHLLPFCLTPLSHTHLHFSPCLFWLVSV